MSEKHEQPAFPDKDAVKPKPLEGESVRVANTSALKQLNRLAIKHELNRSLEPDWLERRLDPDGYHLLVLMLPFHNDADHHRCMVMMKVKGQEEPVEGWLDVFDDDWHGRGVSLFQPPRHMRAPKGLAENV